MSILGVNELELEAHLFFNANIRSFPRNSDNSINWRQSKLHNNDVDAFRHAFVSAIFAMKYGERTAKLLGWLNEFANIGQPEIEENMDFWNNYVGIDYGLRFREKRDRIRNEAKYRKELANLIKLSLENGELIINPNKDSRKLRNYLRFDENKSVVVLEENKTGRNESFCDLVSGSIMSREQFVECIKNGEYKGYRISVIDEIETPVSKPDNLDDNNLD